MAGLGFSSGGAGFSNAGVPSIELPFASDNRKQIQLGSGFVAVPIYIIRKENEHHIAPDQQARATTLSCYWQPKSAPDERRSVPPQLQRAPSFWVDNPTFAFKRPMTEPELMLGFWQKDVDLSGVKTKLKGLVVAGGGFVERVGNKSINIIGGVQAALEPGDFNLRLAADKEMKEECGINPRKVLATKELGLIDFCLQDPRTHGLRYIYLRWLDEQPKATAELSHIVSIPVSKLKLLCEGKITWRRPGSPDSEPEYGLILGHDLLINLLMSHPVVQEFLSGMVAYQPAGPAGGFGW